jgi:ribosomal protein S18 acetylase RimI-like enzyme
MLLRCDAFTLALERDAAGRVEPFEEGLAVLDPSIPFVWDANYVLVERPGLTAEEIAGIADRILGPLGLEHRTVALGDLDEGERLIPGFEALGWEVERDLYMVLRREPDRQAAPEITVGAGGRPEGLRREQLAEDEWLQKQPAPLGPLVDQLLARERAQSRVAGDRWFVALQDGRPASCCRLLARDGIGQVEDVATASWARGRGLARAVVLAAAEVSKADGNELTFLIADADDWPQQLYRRLGFDPVGTAVGFRRPPQASPPRKPPA